jgi:choline-glycine betaine transporter
MYQNQDLEGNYDQKEEEPPRSKPIHICTSLLITILSIVALVIDNKAYGDTECGNIYEICIFILVIACLCILTEILINDGYENRCVNMCIILSYFVYIIWSSYAYSKLVSKDTCFDHYKHDYSTLFYLFVITYAISVGVFIAASVVILLGFVWNLIK